MIIIFYNVPHHFCLNATSFVLVSSANYNQARRSRLHHTNTEAIKQILAVLLIMDQTSASTAGGGARWALLIDVRRNNEPPQER